MIDENIQTYDLVYLTMVVMNLRMRTLHSVWKTHILFECWNQESVEQCICESVMRKSSVVIQHRCIRDVQLQSLLFCNVATFQHRFCTIDLSLSVYSERYKHLLISDIEHSNILFFSIVIEIFSISLLNFFGHSTIILIRNEKIISFVKLVEILPFRL